jgi:hypothetical protein
MASPLSYVPDYTATDQQNKETVQNNFMQQYNLSQNASVKRPTLQSDVDAWSFPGHTKDQLAQIENVFNLARQQYMKETQDMKMLNNLSNVSSYVSTSVTKEYDRLSSLKNKSFSNVHKMRQHYMLKQYDVNYNRFLSGVLQFTLFVSALCGFILLYMFHPVNPLSSNVGLGVIGSILVFYLVVLFFFIKDMQNRRKDDWNKFYFANMDNDKDGKTCGK